MKYYIQIKTGNLLKAPNHHEMPVQDCAEIIPKEYRRLLEDRKDKGILGYYIINGEKRYIHRKYMSRGSYPENIGGAQSRRKRAEIIGKNRWF